MCATCGPDAIPPNPALVPGGGYWDPMLPGGNEDRQGLVACLSSSCCWWVGWTLGWCRQPRLSAFAMLPLSFLWVTRFPQIIANPHSAPKLKSLNSHAQRTIPGGRAYWDQVIPTTYFIGEDFPRDPKCTAEPKSQSYFCPFLWLMEMRGQAQTEPVGRNRPGAPGRRGGALAASGCLPYCPVPTADLAPCLQHSLAHTLNEDANNSACLRVCCKSETN